MMNSPTESIGNKPSLMGQLLQAVFVWQLNRVSDRSSQHGHILSTPLSVAHH